MYTEADSAVSEMIVRLPLAFAALWAVIGAVVVAGRALLRSGEALC